MNSNLSRKRFLRLSALGALAVFVPCYELTALTKLSSKVVKINDIQTAKELAVEAKIAFYKKDYLKAKERYIQCIELVPTQIQYYDCLQNIYSVLKAPIKSIELYKIGLEANLDKPVFYDRLARALVSVEIGNKAIRSKTLGLMNSSTLLDTAKELYEHALTLEEKSYIQIGLDQVNYLKTIKANTLYAHDNESLKLKKINTRNLSKSKYNALDITELLQKKEALDSKVRYKLFDSKDLEYRSNQLAKEKLKIYRHIQNRYYDQGNLSQAIVYAEQCYNLFPKSSHLAKVLSVLYTKTKAYNKYITLKKTWDNNENSYWSKLGLINALDWVYEQTKQPSYLNQATNLVNKLYAETLNTNNLDLQFKVALKTAKLLRKKEDYKASLTIYKRFLDDKETISDRKLKASLGYIKTLLLQGEVVKAKRLLKLALHQINDFSNSEEAILYKATLKVKATAKQSFEYELYRVYEYEGDQSNKQKTLARILLTNKKDSFANLKLKNL